MAVDTQRTVRVAAVLAKNVQDEEDTPLRLMNLVWQAAVVAYLIVWLLLLVDCIRREEFYPVFGNRRGTRVFWLVTFFFFNPALTLFYLIFGCLARPNARPSVVRSALIVMPVVAIIVICHFRPLAVEAQVGVLKAQSGMESTSVVFGGPDGRFPCRRIAIFGQSPHRLMERVAADVQKGLSELPFVEEVVWYPPGERPPDGQLAPDVFVLLDLANRREIKLPFYRRLHATIAVMASDIPYSPTSHRSDNRTPPVICFRNEMTLSHRSSMCGYETARAKYKLVAANIADDIGKTLAKQFADWREKYGSMPELPTSLYGTYRAPTPLPFLPEDATEQVASNRSLMRHNRTTWRFADDRDTTAVLTGIKDQMESHGWETIDLDLGHDSSANLRMTSGTRQIQVYRQRRPRATGRIVCRKRGESIEQMPLIVQYEDALSDAEMAEALGRLLDSNASADTLLIFDRFYPRDSLRDRFLARLEEAPDNSPESTLRLATFYHAEKKDEKARGMLVRTRALLRTAQAKSDIESEIRQLAKAMGDAGLANAPIPLEVFRDLGFVEYTTTSAPIIRKVGLDEPVLLYRKTEKGGCETICLRIRRELDRKGESHYSLAHLVVGDNYRGSGSTSGGRSADVPWKIDHTIGRADSADLVEVESLGHERFRISIRPTSGR